jgi:hypothetical protein
MGIVDVWVIDNDQKSARIKYDLNCLEARLHKCIEEHHSSEQCPDEVRFLGNTLILKYEEYLKLFSKGLTFSTFNSLGNAEPVHWLGCYGSILKLKKKLASVELKDEKINLLMAIATQYSQMVNPGIVTPLALPINNNASRQYLSDLFALFQANDLFLWVSLLVGFCNKHDLDDIASGLFSQEWTLEKERLALDFFSTKKFVNLVNTLFYYKINPEKLFVESLHPEKLVSVGIRLARLYEVIEFLHKLLCEVANKYSLKIPTDYFLHEEDIPPGVVVEFDEELRAFIQETIGQVRIQKRKSRELSAQQLIYDLGRSYKFWFNPNRLIDSAMLLFQCLNKDSLQKKSALDLFFQKMVHEYEHLTTSQCLDLYGYFANNDTRYLFYALHAVASESYLSWLSTLGVTERQTATHLIHILQAVTESLRVVLKNRFVTTKPYHYALKPGHGELIGKRNRQAVLRALIIYCDQLSPSEKSGDLLDDLFKEIN